MTSDCFASTSLSIHLHHGAIHTHITEQEVCKCLQLTFGEHKTDGVGVTIAPELTLFCYGGADQRASLLLLASACVNLAQMFEEDEREAFAAHIQATDVPNNQCAACGNPFADGEVCADCEALAAGDPLA